MAIDLNQAIGSIIPTKDTATQGAGISFFWITIILVILILLALGGIGIWILIRALQFNKKIEIYEDRDGFMEYIGKDRAKEIKYNVYGDSIFFLKKRKRYLPRGEIKVSRNKYLYAIGLDGEWINIGMESINKKLHLAGVKFVHPDMRAFKSGLSKIMKDQYEKKPGFMEKWSPILVPLIFFIIISIALYFIVDRIVASENNLITMTQTSAEVMKEAKNVVSALGSICSGSGIRT